MLHKGRTPFFRSFFSFCFVLFFVLFFCLLLSSVHLFILHACFPVVIPFHLLFQNVVAVLVVVAVASLLSSVLSCRSSVSLSGPPFRQTVTWWGSYGLCIWHTPTELAHSFFFCSCVCICFYGPFNCILFHKISPTTLRFLTLFFRFYLCLIGPFNHSSLQESLLQPWYTP